MKWKNKGHELDKHAEYLVKMFEEKQEKIYVFGAGLWGGTIAPVFEWYQCFGGYIDNNTQKQSDGVNGRKVISFQTYINSSKNGIIVVAADAKNIPAIKGQLEAEGLKKGVDFWVYQEFMQTVFPVISYYKYHILYTEIAQISLTERCTLRCRDCAHGCFAVDPKSSDMDLAVAKQSADSFFSVVDRINEFVLIGGEPFLYSGLAEMIAYAGEKYRDKMMIYSITTNGTIIPDENILDLCRKYEVTIRISNYSGTLVRLKERYALLTKCLDEHHIMYTISEPDQQWMDYGFRSVDRGGDENELTEVFDRCKTPCREIRGSKYYYCVMARSVSDNLGFGVGKDDYLELANLGENGKKVFLEFDMGYSQKGYLDMCNFCHGADAVKYPVPAAVQMN